MASCNSVSCERTAIDLIWRSVVMSVPLALCCTSVLMPSAQSKEPNENICEQNGTHVTNPLKLNELPHLASLTKVEHAPPARVIPLGQDQQTTATAHRFGLSP